MGVLRSFMTQPNQEWNWRQALRLMARLHCSAPAQKTNNVGQQNSSLINAENGHLPEKLGMKVGGMSEDKNLRHN